MLKKFVLGGMVVVAALLGNACGDDGSSDSPAGPEDSEVSLSSSDDVVSGNSSSSSVTESPSTSSGQAPQSAESDGSSSSEKAVDGSSSSDGKASSSSGKVESSSSGKGEKSSSSEGVAGSSSSEVVAESSSSEKSSSSVAESSSSVESSSSEVPSSSSVVESSSSSYFKSSWINLNKSVQYDTIIDSRDNQVYKILTIGEQTWMAENLNYYDTIQTPKLKQHSWCFNNKGSNCELYGRLYDLSVTIGYDTSETTVGKLMQMEMDSNNVQGICPDRFRIPTISDYKKLTDIYNDADDLISERENASGFSISVNSNTGFRNASKFRDKEVRLWSTTYHWGASDNADVLDFKLSSYTYDWASPPSFGCNIRCVKK